MPRRTVFTDKDLNLEIVDENEPADESEQSGDREDDTEHKELPKVEPQQSKPRKQRKPAAGDEKPKRKQKAKSKSPIEEPNDPEIKEEVKEDKKPKRKVKPKDIKEDKPRVPSLWLTCLRQCGYMNKGSGEFKPNPKKGTAEYDKVKKIFDEMKIEAAKKKPI